MAFSVRFFFSLLEGRPFPCFEGEDECESEESGEGEYEGSEEAVEGESEVGEKRGWGRGLVRGRPRPRLTTVGEVSSMDTSSVDG